MMFLRIVLRPLRETDLNRDREVGACLRWRGAIPGVYDQAGCNVGIGRPQDSYLRPSEKVVMGSMSL